eukprot:CAMPEP_0172541554 /NCGR_PEP_ID=MMETSP1067-20121228/12345_1 /TAXON_ID=265564 ORGANISM="Thalassiosira punctigera, Strain Tpunct2005C2" /NCGR_SAMPLE_ID=MMETSP1067 /ASSEMBLY_ACC=CAM_ASM_000444 /LENGTH=1422 /DNA_ID=CAMNT_0013327621 /DNA_START=40 /DNA_END=4309 /DNA_ORIENTATION=+
MFPKAAFATPAAALLFLLLAVATPASAGRSHEKSPWRFLRALQPGKNGNGGGRGGGNGDISVLPEPSVECNVYLALPSRLPDGKSSSGIKSRHLAGEDTLEEGEEEGILHCILDDDSTQGESRIFEIRGLEESERRRVRDQVAANGGTGEHRFAFPGAVKSSLMGGGAGGSRGPNVLTVPGRGPGRKYQALDVDTRLGGYESNTRRNKKRRNRDRRRNLAPGLGVSSVLLLRIEAADDSTSCSHQDCAANNFGGYDTSGNFHSQTLVTQIEDCSYGKLRFVPAAADPSYPALVNGTATVTLTQSVVGVNHGTVLDWTTAVAPALVGPLDQYDHIMVCMPPGVDMGIAVAWGHGGGKYTWYHDSRCLSRGVHMHELGHNLGFGHSYLDESCFMGSGSALSKCYNAPKSYWIGWYNERHMTMDPTKTPSKLVELVGLADYNETMRYGDAETQAVVLRIDMYEDKSIYLIYNRQAKINAGVPEHENKVTITHAEGPGDSELLATLNPGQRYHVPVVVGSGMMLEIVACDRAAGTPDTFTVSIHVLGVGEPMCIPGSSPIPSWGPAYGGALSDMMVGYYAFDDDLLDSSGKGHHGLVGGGTSSFTEGVVGKALSLDGVDDYISLPNVDDFNFGSSDFTLTFWYRVSGDQNGDPAIITNKNWESEGNVGWLVSSDYGPGSNGDDLSITFSDGISRADGSQALDVEFNAWYFVAVRIKRGEMMSLLKSPGGLQEDPIHLVTGSVDSGLPILIGTSHDFEAKTKMDIDDLGIWRRALSSEEVDAIFMVGSGGAPLIQALDPVPPPVDPMPTTLVANYELEYDLRDTSGNDLDAALEDGGGASYDSFELGTYLTLNNVDLPGTFLTLPDSDLLDFGSTTDFTISFWHRTSTDMEASIITNKNFDSGSNPGYTIGVGSNGRLEYNSADGSSRCDYDGPAGVMNDGQWHHVAMTQTQGASGQVALYLDGRKVVQKACALNSHSSGYAIKVGASWVYPSLYTGDIDKIMIHRSALSHANIFSLYGNGQSLTMTSSPTSSLPPTRSPTVRPTNTPSSPPTLKPTESPLSCDGVLENVWCCGSKSQKQADYRGTISVTQAGIECQAWSAQSPHSHTGTPGNYPNSGLDENYCRNPDGEPRAWCYTSSASTRWDYCDVPYCGPTPDPTRNPTLSPTLGPTPLPTLSPSNSPTLDPTLNPTEIPTLSPTQFPTETPTLKLTPSPTEEPTPAPSASPTPNPTTEAPTKSPITPDPTPNPTPALTFTPTPEPECTGIDNTCCGSFWFGVEQADYRGTISKTVGGIECQAWSSQSPHSHGLTPEDNPDAGLDQNYCRNPDGEPRAWCYTSSSSKRWDYCDVPSCPACEAGNPDQCGCSEVLQADYRGPHSQTKADMNARPGLLRVPTTTHAPRKTIQMLASKQALVEIQTGSREVHGATQ